MVNIGAGRSYTIAETVSAVLNAAGHRGASIVFDHTKPVTIPCRMLDISKARQSLGFEPKMGLEQGIKDTVEWYVSKVGCETGIISNG